MAPNPQLVGDTALWRFQAWASFILAFGTTLVGIGYLPIELWGKAFMAMGVLFTTGSAFTLSKTIRDAHEMERLHNRITEAKAERMLRDYELGAAPATARGAA